MSVLKALSGATPTLACPAASSFPAVLDAAKPGNRREAPGAADRTASQRSRDPFDGFREEKSLMMRTSDSRVVAYEQLISPVALLDELPLSREAAASVERSRDEVR